MEKCIYLLARKLKGIPQETLTSQHVIKLIEAEQRDKESAYLLIEYKSLKL